MLRLPFFMTVTGTIYWQSPTTINHTRDQSSAKEVVPNLFIGLWNRKEDLRIENPAHYLATATKFAAFKEY
jgi:hypothetical protein